MNATIWLLTDPKRPGRYLLARQAGHRNIVEGEAEIIRWSDARAEMSDETFFRNCRMSFTHWCTSNPELVDADLLDD